MQDESDIYDDTYLMDYSADKICEYNDKQTDPSKPEKLFEFDVQIEFDYIFDMDGKNSKDAKKKLKECLEEDYGWDSHDYLYFRLVPQKFIKM